MQEESAPLLRILHFSGEAEATGKGWIIQSKVTVYANHKIDLVLHYFLDLEILTKIGQEFELP